MASTAVRKIESHFYQAIVDGSKTFEIRKFDSELAGADYLTLVEIKDGKKTGRSLTKKIGFMMTTSYAKALYEDIAEDEEMIVMSLIETKKEIRQIREYAKNIVRIVSGEGKTN